MNEFLQKAQQRREQRESNRAKRMQEGQKFGKRLDGYTQDLEKNLKNILDENETTNITNEETSFTEALKARKAQAQMHSQAHSQAHSQERAQKTHAPKTQNPQTPAPKQDLQNTKDSQIVKVSQIIKDSQDGWDSQIMQITQITPSAEDSKIVYLHQQNTIKTKRANFDIKSRKRELERRKIIRNLINLYKYLDSVSKDPEKHYRLRTKIYIWIFIICIVVALLAKIFDVLH